MNVHSVDLNLLKVFAALFDTRKQTLAAHQVGLSQPALSHALKRLQDTFNDDLFLRKGGAYHPTRRAIELEKPVARALDLLSEAFEDYEKFKPEDAIGRVSLAVSDFGSGTILPPLCEEIARRAPNIQLIVSQLSYQGYEAGLKSGEIDIAITSQKPDNTDIRSEKILTESAVYIARQDHPKLGELGTLDGFIEAEHVIVNLYGRAESWLDLRLAELGKRRRVRMVVPYFNSVPDIVTRTELIGGLPQRLAMAAMRDFPVRMFRLPFDFRDIGFFMCWNARRDRDAELRWFRQRISEVCNHMNSGMPSSLHLPKR